MDSFSQLDGILLVDKPVGWSSFKVVAVVRRRLSEVAGRKVKVGHAGTLDPFASGLLIILVGDACKQAGSFLKLDKSYQVFAVLGVTSMTGDPEGERREVSTTEPSRRAVEDSLNQFQGRQLQKPPAYSAIKINGQRAYNLARRGKEVDIPSRPIVIHSIELTTYAYPKISFNCLVSSGTYIRSLVEDIGNYLGVGAYTSGLRRTSVGACIIEQAIDIDSESRLEDKIMPVAR
ncbi:MAG TPA: tRNA pseudouridine(55) synthase TruB [Candidatus Saccharimonadales bacterium]|nr:tRNA pseudouridine(55) synthase TruB [Candidatus Saccharimonadales bacterium]